MRKIRALLKIGMISTASHGQYESCRLPRNCHEAVMRSCHNTSKGPQCSLSAMRGDGGICSFFNTDCESPNVTESTEDDRNVGCRTKQTC